MVNEPASYQRGAHRTRSVRFPTDIVEWVNNWREKNGVRTFGGAVIQILTQVMIMDSEAARKGKAQYSWIRPVQYVLPSLGPATPRRAKKR